MTTQERWRRRLTRGSVAVAMAVSLSAISITSGNPSSALGPVIALTPFGTDPTSIQGEPTSVSARGELVGVVDAELNRVAAIAFDDGDLEPAFAGRGVSVTGNGCGVMWLDDSDVERQIIFYSDQCNQGNTRVFLLSNFDPILERAKLPTPARGFTFRSALSFDGNFAAIQLQAGAPGTAGNTRVVMHIDLRRSANGQPFAIPMRTQSLPGDETDARFGLDISDDGTFVVVPVRIPFIIGFGSPAALGTDNRDLFVAGWRVGSNPIVVNSDTAQLPGSAAYPSTSRDGRFVSFASDVPLAGGESGRGPWVYVKEIGRSGFRLVSPADASAYYTSITSDATQVAFGRSQSCQIGDLIEFQCPPFQIDVAFGPTPGLTGAFQAETVSIGASGRISGEHHWPYLSGNGRYVAWESNAGPALTGNGQIDNEFHAFIRRRDPGLTVGDVAFGPVLASNSGTGTSTVVNTGRDTIAINSVAVTSGPFAVTGGSCGAGVTLGPGASCTVNLRFDASLPAQAVNGTLTVSETGFDATSASGRLTGTVTTTTTTSTTQPTVVDTTTTTTTTTTIAGQNPIPTVPPITLGTLPGEPVLSASPNPVDFGDAPVLIASDIRTVTVTNSGTGGGNVVSTIGGTNPADFALVGGTCRIGTLLPGRTCTLDYRMTATASGDRSAQLVVTADDASATVDFLGVGRFEPRVAVTPATVTERGITTILGQGYPPGVDVTVRVDDALVLTATPDDAGIFRIPISPLGQLDLGPHDVSVDDAPGLYEGPEAAFVVVLPTFSPQGPTGPAFNNNLLVARG